jgi:hypothetical protein
MHPSLAYDLADFRALKYFTIDAKLAPFHNTALRLSRMRSMSARSYYKILIEESDKISNTDSRLEDSNMGH